MGETRPKIRFRTYDGKDSFLEKKLHVGSQTTKERVPVTAKPVGLDTVGEIQYQRTEYNFEGVRITMDKGPFPFIVIEVKGRLPKALEFLRPFENKEFSKWKYLTGKFKDVLS